MQAINATTMPKVVICHTPVIHNHYMECNALKLPSLGSGSLRPRVSLVFSFPQTQTDVTQHVSLFPVMCVVSFLLLSTSVVSIV